MSKGIQKTNFSPELKKEFDDTSTNAKNAKNNIGVLNNLKTTNKNDLVGALNELFQNASNGKSLIANAITGKGIESNSNMTFDQLSNNISNIQTGVKESEILNGNIQYYLDFNIYNKPRTCYQNDVLEISQFNFTTKGYLVERTIDKNSHNTIYVIYNKNLDEIEHMDAYNASMYGDIIDRNDISSKGLICGNYGYVNVPSSRYKAGTVIFYPSESSSYGYYLIEQCEGNASNASALWVDGKIVMVLYQMFKIIEISVHKK